MPPPAIDGRWRAPAPFTLAPPHPVVDDGLGHRMRDPRGLFALHAILLHTGRVLCFSGHVEVFMYAPLFYQFDPNNPSAAMAPIEFPANPDMFCGHYVQLPDGRILAAGGSQHDVQHEGHVAYRGSNGTRTIAIFDPRSVPPAWTLSRTGGAVNQLEQGRWYPTLVSLPDGRVAVFSGRREAEAGIPPPWIADDVEILSPPDWAATRVRGATKALPLYPGLHLAPNGRIYYAHANWGQEMPDPETASLWIPNGRTAATWRTYRGLRPPDPRREEGTSVLLPPAQDGRILVIGGSKALKPDGQGIFEGQRPNGPAAFDHIHHPADARSANILDTSTNPPKWSRAGTLAHGRINANCVLLPDGTVFICGGHDNYKWWRRPQPRRSGTTPSLAAEIYTPGRGFRTVASMTEPRMYHSVALLLPDGRVFTAGGADPNREEPTLSYPADWNRQRRYGRGQPLNSKTYEIYEPPYMHNGPRPVITDVLRRGVSVRRIRYGDTFIVRSPQAASITRVAFMRPGAATHHTDTEQRYVRLEFTRRSGELTVRAAASSRLAPPGFYMLWIVDAQGRPCTEAVFIQLSRTLR